jgi:hypothetical protein
MRSILLLPPGPSQQRTPGLTVRAAIRRWGMVGRSPKEHAMSTTILLPFQPDSMRPAQLAAVSYLAR